jgi:Carboxypeptidase regulatory-like domain
MNGMRLTRRLIPVAVMVFLFWPGGRTDAQKAKSVSRTSGGRVISGVIVNSVSGQTLEATDVTLTDMKTAALIAETASDAQGRFVFSNLPDGKYALRAAHRGYLASAFDEHDGFSSAIVTGEGLVTTDLKFFIKLLAVISGAVSDESGDPVQQGRVQLYREDERSGTGRIVRAGATVTDDLGNYEFPRLSPGNYYIAVMAQPWFATAPGRMPADTQERAQSPLDVAYATTFYADVTDSEQATPIPVKAGDRIPVNFMLHPVPAVHISMQLAGDNNMGRGGIPALRQDVFGSMEVTTLQSVRYSTHEDGAGGVATTSVELGGVAPGHYEMEMRSSPRGGTGTYVNVDASLDHFVVNPSAGESLAVVSGKATMLGVGDWPQGLGISLVPQQGDDIERSRVERDGNFEIRNVYPGTYELEASAAGTTVAMTRITIAGAPLEGRLLKVGNASITLAATLVEGSTSLSGFAKSGGKPAEGVMVVLVPASPGVSRELFRRDQSNSDGSFTLKNAVPGEYTLVAIQDGWTLDWARAEVIGHYLPRGQKVTIPARGRDIQITDAVIVQAR